MSACACEHCSCECDECYLRTYVPTPEEMALIRAREEQREADRWTPARDQMEQWDKDVRVVMDALGERISEQLYAPVPAGWKISGLGDL